MVEQANEEVSESSRQKLTNALKLYEERTGNKVRRVGQEVLNDPKFGGRFLAGAGCNIDTYDKLIKWLEVNTPEAEPEMEIRQSAP